MFSFCGEGVPLMIAHNILSIFIYLSAVQLYFILYILERTSFTKILKDAQKISKSLVDYFCNQT